MSDDNFKNIVSHAIEEAAADLNQLSQQIWSHPELNYQEYHAHDTLCEFLQKYGFNVERKYLLDTAFRATFGNIEQV